MTPLDVANRSPDRVRVHDRQGWLDLFAPGATVEDPVGAPPHAGSAIGAFWDTFIAQNGIRFEVHQDVVYGDTVLRDLTIHTTLSTGAVLQVPAHLEYRIDGDRVVSLRAYWELPSMVWQATLLGPRAWWATTWMSVAMLGNQGPGFVLRYLASMWGVGARGKARARAWAAGDRGVRCLIDGQPGDAPPDVVLSKALACADHVAATVEHGGRRGVGIFRFEGRELVEVRIAWSC